MNTLYKSDSSRLDRRHFFATAGAAFACLSLAGPAAANSNGRPSVVRDITAANLRGAYGGESMAFMRYMQWAKHAEKDEKPNVGRLFRAIAAAEQVHAENHFVELTKHPGEELVASMAVFGLGSTADNIQGGIDGEVFEVEEMYPAFLAVARKQNEKGAVRTFEYALEAEKAHITLFEKAKAAVDNNVDVALEQVGVCDICGYTIEGEIPARCPICGHSHRHFIVFE